MLLLRFQTTLNAVICIIFKHFFSLICISFWNHITEFFHGFLYLPLRSYVFIHRLGKTEKIQLKLLYRAWSSLAPWSRGEFVAPAGVKQMFFSQYLVFFFLLSIFEFGGITLTSFFPWASSRRNWRSRGNQTFSWGHSSWVRGDFQLNH